MRPVSCSTGVRPMCKQAKIVEVLIKLLILITLLNLIILILIRQFILELLILIKIQVLNIIFFQKLNKNTQIYDDG